MTLVEDLNYQILSIEGDVEVLRGRYIGYDEECDTYQFETEDSDTYECITGEDLADCYDILMVGN